MAKHPKKKTKTKHAGVFRLSEGGWWIQATQRDENGKRCARRKSLPASLSIEEAARERAKLVTELEVELKTKAVAKRRPAKKETRRSCTVSDYVLSWSANKKEQLRMSTREHYADILGRFVVPVLGDRLVLELTRTDVLDWVSWAETQKSRFDRAYSTATLGSWWRVLVTLLKDAAAEFGIPDPTNRVRPPRSKVRNVREGVTLTPEQVGKLLCAVKEHFPSWYAEIFVLVFSGVRPGELHALSWEDVDEEMGVIHVRHAVWRGHVDATKTDDPRDIALTERLREVLKEHKAAQEREEHPGLKKGLVFPAANGSYRITSSLEKVLRLAGKAAGIPTRVGPQVLRRTMNTNLVELEVNGVILRSQMGHTSEAMTSRYAGVHPEAKRAAVDRFHAAVEAAGNTGR